MLVERWRHIESLFCEALPKSPAERARFLDEACSGEIRPCAGSGVAACSRETCRRFRSSRTDRVRNRPGPPILCPRASGSAPYTVIELLGSGGMGEVYKAHDERLDRDIAVKFLSSRIAGDAASLDRFEREARAASALNHPNICTVHDVGENADRRYRDGVAGGPVPQRSADGRPAEHAGTCFRRSPGLRRPTGRA